MTDSKVSCQQCGGTGTYHYNDENHSRPCDKCCKHDNGWFLVKSAWVENHRIVRTDAGPLSAAFRASTDGEAQSLATAINDVVDYHARQPFDHKSAFADIERYRTMADELAVKCRDLENDVRRINFENDKLNNYAEYLNDANKQSAKEKSELVTNNYELKRMICKLDEDKALLKATIKSLSDEVEKLSTRPHPTPADGCRAKNEDHVVLYPKSVLFDWAAKNTFGVGGGTIDNGSSTTVMPPNPKDAYGKAKPSLSAIPASALIYLGQAMAYGARKYGLLNFRSTPVEALTYYDAAMRHLLSWVDGEEFDGVEGVEDEKHSGLPHLSHVMACAAILLDATRQGMLIDNRGIAGNVSSLIQAFTKVVARG